MGRKMMLPERHTHHLERTGYLHRKGSVWICRRSEKRKKKAMQ
ncbi:hypothetical protein A2U01_0042369, partial [Trifolium medium]|nr:hypothetical protein [Trifolium medium]